MNAQDQNGLLARLRADREEAMGRVRKFDQLIDNVLDLYPDLRPSTPGGSAAPARAADADVSESDVPESPDSSSTGTKDIIAAVFEASNDRWLSVSEVYDEMRVRGWRPQEGTTDPIAAVRKAIQRFPGLVARRRDGRANEFVLATYAKAPDATGAVDTAGANGGEADASTTAHPVANHDH